MVILIYIPLSPTLTEIDTLHCPKSPPYPSPHEGIHGTVRAEGFKLGGGKETHFPLFETMSLINVNKGTIKTGGKETYGRSVSLHEEEG